VEITDNCYVFGILGEELCLRYEIAFNQIAQCMLRDYEKWIEEYKTNSPEQNPEPQLVQLGLFYADESTPLMLRDLKQQFPGYSRFIVTTRFLGNALQRSAEFQHIGEVEISHYSEQPQTVLNRKIWTFQEDVTTAPLWQ
jgi:hypothetical protein